MKKISILLLLAASFTLTACVDDASDVAKVAEGNKVTDLKVPSEFDWKTTGAVTCNITSSKSTLVTVATSATEEPFASFYAGGTADAVQLSMPLAVKTLFVSYKTATGVSTPKAVPVINKAITFAVGSDSAAPAPASVGTRAFGDIDMDREDGVVYIPAKKNGWGTMLFEDLWPSYGDYDFNDMVANYKMQLYVDSNNQVEAMMVGVRIKAIGGSLPNDLYLQMTGSVTSDKIGDIILQAPTTKGATMENVPSIDPKKNRAFFLFAGMRDNKNKPAGSHFLNTERGKEIADDQMVELCAVVYFTELIPLKKFTFTAPDFFIMRKDKADKLFEIHCREYEPVFKDAYKQALTDANKPEPKLWYSSSDEPVWNEHGTIMANKNLVWGLNIPTDIRHAYEKQDFMVAYPEFKGWVESNGVQNLDWYKHGVKSELVYKK
ncbi:MAG: LruC domain-containing protein [Alistipes sp.]